MTDAILGIVGMVMALVGFVGVLYLGVWIDARLQAKRAAAAGSEAGSEGKQPAVMPGGTVDSTEQE